MFTLQSKEGIAFYFETRKFFNLHEVMHLLAHSDTNVTVNFETFQRQYKTVRIFLNLKDTILNFYGSSNSEKTMKMENN